MPLTAFALMTDPIFPAGSQTFNSSGTYTVPYGARVITVTGTGGNGQAGNAGNDGNNGTAGPGGAGGTAGTAGLSWCAALRHRIRSRRPSRLPSRFSGVAQNQKRKLGSGIRGVSPDPGPGGAW